MYIYIYIYIYIYLLIYKAFYINIVGIFNTVRIIIYISVYTIYYIVYILMYIYIIGMYTYNIHAVWNICYSIFIQLS